MPKNVVCKKCNNLVNGWCEKVIDSPDQHIVRDCQYFREETNADRIRSMTDEELALWICGVYDIEEENGKFINGIIIPGYAPHDIEEWLQQTSPFGVDDVPYCPNCKCSLPEVSYCEECGQAIDWEASE